MFLYMGWKHKFEYPNYKMGLNSPVLSFLLIILSSSITLSSNLPIIAKSGCIDTCGNVSIPFPFGINHENCYLSPSFRLTCDDTTSQLLRGNIPVIDISLEGQLWINKRISYLCFNQSGQTFADAGDKIFKVSSSFNFNSSSNVFVVVGCDSYAYFNGLLRDKGNSTFSTGCISFCKSIKDVSADDGSCSGAGCCEVKIPAGISNLNTSLSSLNNYTYLPDINNCIYASIVEKKSFIFSQDRLTKLWNSDMFPALLDWSIVDNDNCFKAQASADYACKQNTSCQDIKNPLGYRCHCKQGYQGNPYLDAPGGCTDVDECKLNNHCKDNSVCQNTPGSYTCKCLQGYEGDGFVACKDVDECQRGNHTCPEESSACNNIEGSYKCICKSGFRGTPDLHGIGCVDIDECREGTHNCKKNSYCLNTIGNFKCECKKGYRATEADNCERDQQVYYQVVAGISVASLFILLATVWLCFILKKRKSIQRKEMMRQKFFEENGGLLLMGKFSQLGGDTREPFYSENELEAATDNFAECNILGQGGYGVVFKGYLRGMSIAVKKSKQMDRSQKETFANEVLLLTQINHRNVVRLLGCCLTTQSPLLIYEFIDNGTLSSHIHDSPKTSFLPLEIRLRIATETAEVLSYLHTAASPPVIHRDIKSENILLDKNYTAKLSDFGISRLFSLDETQLSTAIQGTIGYLDPEYMQTGKLTVKSDVYSFGVLMMEIMTGLKVAYFDRQGEKRFLAKHFLSCLDENRLSEILDVSLQQQEGNYNLMIEVALLAKRCVSIRGEDRPSMREVAAKLRGLSDDMKKTDFQAKTYGSTKMEPLLLESSVLNGFDGFSIPIDASNMSTMSSLGQLGTADGR